MENTKFPVFQEKDGILTKVEIASNVSQLYVMKHCFGSLPYEVFPIPEEGHIIYHCFNGTNDSVVITKKTKEEILEILIPLKRDEYLSTPKIEILKPVNELKTRLFGREFQVKDENSFNSCDDENSKIEISVWGKPTLKINGKLIRIRMSKKSTTYQGGMSFPILNIGGIGVALVATNTLMPTKFEVRKVVNHKKVNLDIFKRIRTITETKDGCMQTIHYEFY
jgi:hypothetical protein